MATTTKLSLFTLSLALITFLAMSAPKSNALVINGETLNAISIVGTARCSSTITGPCTTCAPLNGVTVFVTHNGNVLASANTASNGAINITIDSPSVLAQITSVNDLRVRMNLPIPSCPLYAGVSTGHLEGCLLRNIAFNTVFGVSGLVRAV